MKYNLANIEEATEAFWYLTLLGGKEATVEIKKISPKRSLPQNNYLHLLLTAFGDHFGYDIEEAKAVYKYANAEIYKYKKNKITFWRSSADLTKDEMTLSIDKFRKFSAEHGCELPLAVDQEWLRRIENDHERMLRSQQ
ncbi:MAG: hypothetical protein KGL39_54530 [Patescibacteria group bacterium]|nr:hypothetical protein [Patescibacteria group bacterium]